MNYDSPIPPNQGNEKLSEIGVDREQPIIGSAVNESALKVLEQHFKISTDLANKQNYIFRSEGSMTWDGTSIRFDANAIANHAILEVLQTVSTIIPRYQFRLQGTTGANTANTFRDVTLNDGELLYLEIDPAQLTTGNLVGGAYFQIENAVSGGSIVSGRTLKKVLINEFMGMPTIKSLVDGSISTTYYIAIAYRRGTNVYWIPHGITWPQNTTSPLGSVIVSGLQVLPERFAGNEAELAGALTDLAADDGGIILLTQGFTITNTHTIPANVTIVGRGYKSTINCTTGKFLIPNVNVTFENFRIQAAGSFTGDLVAVTGNRSRMRNMIFDITNATNVNTNRCISIASSHNRLFECWFINVATTNKVGINYSTNVLHTNNADVDSISE